MSDLEARIRRGMERQLEQRSARLQEGARPVGWKVGFGTAAAMEQLGVSAPLVGFLTDATRVESGATVSVSDWAKPMFEPEVAVHIAHDLQAGADPGEVERAISGLGPAIELIDPDPLPPDPEEVLAGNIVHRGFVLGPPRPGTSLEGVRGRVLVDEEESARADDPQALPGQFVALTAHVAGVLESVGERLRGGEVIITGSMVAPLPIRAGRRFRYELDPVGTLELTFG
ncbi:MAG: 2-keto-4-pentenoate hydratase [Actinomycetota bacterium]